MILLILAAILVAIIASLILYARWNFGVLEAMGIPVVKYHWLLGATHDCHKTVTNLEDIARFKKHGPVYGVYEGRSPQVHVCDAELIKHIFVKDFDHFNARRDLDFGSPLLNEMPDFLKGVEKWKFVRQLTTPTLTPAKIKVMSVSMKEALKDWVAELKGKVEKNGGKAINTDVRTEIYVMLTDLISRCVFNIKIDNNNDPNNPFVKILKQLMAGETTQMQPFMIPLQLSFPFLKKFVSPILSISAADDFVKIFKQLIKNRRQAGRTEKDYTETVINWLDQLDSPEYKKNNITELTILCQVLVIFFAGQDQISSVLTYAIYQSCQKPEIQAKINKELDAFLARHNGQIEYEHLGELTYLTACLTEALRLVPVFIRSERVCTKDWEHEGFKIKKGTVVLNPIWASNRNPKHFPDPETFDPDRFLPENKSKLHPYAFMSFGFGPRNCIGMRLALDILVLSGAHVFKDFQFKVNSDTKFTHIPGSIFLSLFEPIMLDMSTRR